MNNFNGVISGEYQLLSSLSHIGETAGIDSFLNTQFIVNGDSIEEVFAYSGNAIRGALRDSAAEYMLNAMQSTKKINKDLFHLLFSGGNINGEQKTDIQKAIKIRQDIPMVSVFGGGIGSAILSGKIDVSDGYPICKETKSIIPDLYSKECNTSWRTFTSERSYTRTDDTKEIKKTEKYLDIQEDIEENKKGTASTQMRYNVEVLNAGTKLFQFIQLENLTEIELGCLVSAMVKMANAPYLGGKKNIGMGRYKVIYKFQEELFLEVDKEGKIKLSQIAQDAMDAYLVHIKSVDIEEVDIWKK